MLICPSEVGNSPVGMPVGWSLPACLATSPAISQREAWKSSMKICASSSEVWTHWPSPALLALDQRHQDRLREQQPGAEIVDRDADPHRPLARQAGDRHQPAHALGDLVDPRPLGIGPALAEAGDAAIDDARVDLLDRLVIDAEAEFHLRAEILDDDVGLLRQLQKDRLAPPRSSG